MIELIIHLLSFIVALTILSFIIIMALIIRKKYKREGDTERQYEYWGRCPNEEIK